MGKYAETGTAETRKSAQIKAESLLNRGRKSGLCDCGEQCSRAHVRPPLASAFPESSWGITSSRGSGFCLSLHSQRHSFSLMHGIMFPSYHQIFLFSIRLKKILIEKFVFMRVSVYIAGKKFRVSGKCGNRKGYRIYGSLTQYTAS